jgi:hypothetical protein
MSLLAKLVCAAGVCLACVNVARADPVTWDFVETSCTSENGGCNHDPNQPPLEPPLPQVVATFSSPDPGGFYILNTTLPNEPPNDTNFTFQWYTTAGVPFIIAPELEPSLCGCEWAIEWAGPPTLVFYEQSATSANISLPFFGGGFGSITASIGSDGFIAGCGFFAQCTIAGFWEQSSVPEPRSITLLGAALGFFALLPLASRRQRIIAGLLGRATLPPQAPLRAAS